MLFAIRLPKELLMAKCPWCGGQVIVLGSDTFRHTCRIGCYISLSYLTKSEALASASKRFMPKRTVEEIVDCIEAEDNSIHKALLSFHDNEPGDDYSERCNSFWRYLKAVKQTRISGYIAGATE